MADRGDEYERRYMQGQGEVLHRSKMRAPTWFFALMLLPILIQIVTFALLAATTPGFPKALLALPAVLTPVLLLVALLFAVLRVTVSEREVHVQYGLFGPRIPVSSIQSAEVVGYDWKQYGGWGIRRGRDGSWAYNMLGDAGRAVRVVWSGGVHLLVASDPEGLAAAIRRAMGGNANADADAHADANADAHADANADALADADADADADAEARERRA